jgi:hypothetical protein
VLLHHRNEEIEHAMMNLEWIRRRESAFDERMRTYLFKDGDILGIEAAAEKAGAPAAREGGGDGALGVGSLRASGAESV